MSASAEKAAQTLYDALNACGEGLPELFHPRAVCSLAYTQIAGGPQVLLKAWGDHFRLLTFAVRQATALNTQDVEHQQERGAAYGFGALAVGRGVYHTAIPGLDRRYLGPPRGEIIEFAVVTQVWYDHLGLIVTLSQAIIDPAKHPLPR